LTERGTTTFPRTLFHGLQY